MTLESPTGAQKRSIDWISLMLQWIYHCVQSIDVASNHIEYLDNMSYAGEKYLLGNAFLMKWTVAQQYRDGNWTWCNRNGCHVSYPIVRRLIKVALETNDRRLRSLQYNILFPDTNTWGHYYLVHLCFVFPKWFQPLSFRSYFVRIHGPPMCKLWNKWWAMPG
jgi:hypothetical protein